MRASAPNRRASRRILSSSVAITSGSGVRARPALSHTCWSMVLPAMRASGFPGKREDSIAGWDNSQNLLRHDRSYHGNSGSSRMLYLKSAEHVAGGRHGQQATRQMVRCAVAGVAACWSSGPGRRAQIRPRPSQGPTPRVRDCASPEAARSADRSTRPAPISASTPRWF